MTSTNRPSSVSTPTADRGQGNRSTRNKLFRLQQVLAGMLCLAVATLVNIETSEGMIVLELDATQAPGSVENFLAYVNDGFYDGTIFHRVIDGFMIQGGGFTEEYERKDTRDPISNEANNGMKNRRYSIAMARTNSPHSATAQFFINTVDNNSALLPAPAAHSVVILRRSRLS